VLLIVEDVDFNDDGDSDDDDFIEVAAKEGFEPTIPEHRREEYGFATAVTRTSAAKSWQQKDCQLDIEDPTSPVGSLMKRQLLEQEKMVSRLADCLVCHLYC